ncbi:glycosyl hydrolase 108 family protein [Pelagerythrobacter marensis]|uniref:Glycosyl hydrolase 108 family protein n=1 Tax=Pelagerythrobacter marensis TaxID=543877 RepID=A0ABZ2D213_9SPHN
MAELKKRATLGIAAAIGAIVLAVVSIEGDFVDHRDDPGGKTRHGITEEVAREHGYTGDMRSLPIETAIEIYGTKYVTRPGFDAIVQRNVALGEEVVDQGVNFGPHRPSCWMQTALNSLNRGGRDYRDLAVDCRVGPATMDAYDSLARKRGATKACELVLKLMEAQQGAEYLRLTHVNSRLETFMPGWIDHRLGNVPIDRCREGGVQ